ncbi:hypothetical protein EDD21DRAFT_357290 [Dissophora ornata]|nr:hypothetical protein EDD21DRAFT_357290 [Dissophora ornata]
MAIVATTSGRAGRAAAAHWHLPIEIILLVAQHLDRDSLLRCIRLNHEWHNALEPLLWHCIILHPFPLYSVVFTMANPFLDEDDEDEDNDDPDHPLPSLELILKNAPHIRQLATSKPHPALLALSQLAEGCSPPLYPHTVILSLPSSYRTKAPYVRSRTSQVLPTLQKWA